MKNELDKELKLSGVRALLGHVTPPLRNVSLDILKGKIIWKCVFDETASEDDLELVSMAATEVIADFPNYGLKEVYEKVDVSEKVNPLKNMIYQRNENNYYRD